MTKFTKGPWENEDFTITADDGSTIAVVHSIGDFPCIEEDNSQQQIGQLIAEFKANADLVTAAPDLYAACEVGFTALWAIKARLIQPRTESEKMAMDELQRRMDILGAALRKARGETPVERESPATEAAQ